MRKVLLLDGYNLLYRARSGYTQGEYPIVYNFFRSLRALVEKFSPDVVYFSLEGVPVERMAELDSYKAQRVYHDDDGFQRQKTIIVNLLKRRFPMKVIRHGMYEADDLLANIALKTHKDDECILISSDTDFLQLYDQHNNVKVYNPVKKKVAEKPTVDYVLWKSLRGDASDNIPGFKGIGDKRAARLIEDPKALESFLSKGDRRQLFERNQRLIKFHDMSEDFLKVECSSPELDWPAIRAYFNQMGFKSITNDSSWEKFLSTFVNLPS